VLRIVVLLSLLAAPALGQVYKCVDPDGKISFSSSPYCSHQQAYAEGRQEPLQTVSLASLARTSPSETIELHYQRARLADRVEIIGDVAGIPVEAVALEGYTLAIEQQPRSWLEIFDELVAEQALDYRQAYGKVYVYKKGTMGETIVHNADLLRWYQDQQSWNQVLKNDRIMLAMRSYRDSELRDRLPGLLRRVREDLGEHAHSNAAEGVELKETFSAGVGGSVAAARSPQEIRNQQLQSEAEKRRAITEKRQSNSAQRQANSQSRCFSSSGHC
jgi:hypothetical protein